MTTPAPAATPASWDCGHPRDLLNTVLHKGKWSCRICAINCHRASLGLPPLKGGMP